MGRLHNGLHRKGETACSLNAYVCFRQVYVFKNVFIAKRKTFLKQRSKKRLNRKDIRKTEIEKLTQFSAIIMLLKKCEMSHLSVNCSRTFSFVEPLKSYMRKGQDNTKFYYFQALYRLKVAKTNFISQRTNRM